MNYEKYSNLVGKHALFSPSSVCLIDKTDKDIIRYWARKYIPEIGTALHDIARAHIAKAMGFKNDSSVRSLLNDQSASKMNKSKKTADTLKQCLKEKLKDDPKAVLDVGVGVERELGVSKEKLNEALYIMQDSEAGYKLNLVYNATVSPSEKGYESRNDSPDAVAMSWEVSTTSVSVAGHKPTAHITIDSTKVKDKTKLKELEDKLYGTSDAEPTLPSPDEVLAIFAVA